MYKRLLVILTSIIAISLPCNAIAQEEDTEYSGGTVVEVNASKNEIVVNKYDWENDEEVTVTYSIDPDVKLENVNSLKEIGLDTYVDIEYIVQEDGKKIAKLISVYQEEFSE